MVHGEIVSWHVNIPAQVLHLGLNEVYFGKTIIIDNNSNGAEGEESFTHIT